MMRKANRSWHAALALLMMAPAVYAHVTVLPRESSAGRRETYTMRVPTERQSATVRIEVEFPPEVSVREIPAKEGWQAASREDSDGRIVAVVWTGGSIAPGQAEEFEFIAENPDEETTLVWKAIQVHADNSRAEWIGEAGSRSPAPMTVIRPGPTQ